MNTRRSGAWWLGGLAGVLCAGTALANGPVGGSIVPQPIAADGGELRISAGSDVTSLRGEDLRRAAKHLVAPLLAAGIRFQTLILVDADTDIDFQSYSIAELQ